MTMATPIATATAMPSRRSAWRAPGMRVRSKREGWAVAFCGRLITASIGLLMVQSFLRSNLHVHDVFVRIDELVAYFGDGAEREVRALQRDHHAADVGAGIAALELVGKRIRAVLRGR